MSIYDQNFNTIFQQLLPPDKRSKTAIAWGKVLVKPLQWLHDLTYDDYANGTSAIDYNSLTTYNKGDRIIYNQKVYEAKQTTTGNTPTTGDSADANWMLVLNDFRGSRERVTYNGQKITLEWILNKWFMTTFVQPVYNPPSANSDFWIENLITDDDTFLLKADSNSGPSYMTLNDYAQDFMKLTYTANIDNFTVHYPLAVIPTTSDPKYIQMVALVTKYKLYGTIAKYVGY